MHLAGATVESNFKNPTEMPPRANEADVTAAFRRLPGAWVDVGHSRLAYWRLGTGPDVVFVHGWPLHSATFRRVLPFLTDQFTCHLLDLPGAGQSVCHEGAPIDLESHAVSLRRAIDRLGLDRYALVAHDSGGLVARLIAKDDERVAGLVLGNTELPEHHAWLIELYAFSVRLPGGMGVVRSLIKSRAVRRSALGFGGCFSDVSYADGDFHELFIRPLLESKETAEAQLRVLQTLDWKLVDDLEAVHRSIFAPARLIWGARDPFFPVERAKKTLSQFAGGADFREIAAGKLFAHEEYPEEFAEHAKAFLVSCLGRGASASEPSRPTQ